MTNDDIAHLRLLADWHDRQARYLLLTVPAGQHDQARKHPRRSSWKGPPMPNLPRVMLRAPLCVVAWTLLLQVGLAAPDEAPLADGSHDQPTRTAKERLGVKAE